MSERMGLEIGKKIGKAIELDGGAIGRCLGKFLKVRVRIDITKPLMKAINMIVNGEAKHVTVFLSYERLPEFC